MLVVTNRGGGGRTRTPLLLAGPLLILLTASVGPAYADAQYEGVAFGVELYGGPSPQCNAAALNSARNDAAAVSDALAAMGYGQTQYWEDAHVDGYDFIDPSICWWCQDYLDPSGVDFADAAFFSGHGTRTCSGGTYSSYLCLGDSTSTTNACMLPLNNMRLSNTDGDANILMLAACQSAQKCVWENHGLDAIKSGSTQFNILNGFHGLSWDNDDNTWRYGHYVELAELEGLGDDWVDWLTDAEWYYPEDQCATSVTWGSTSAACDNQQFHGGFLDFKITHPLAMSKYYYLSPCDPEDGEAL